MARIVGGSPLGELSGKMGGLVFARNKGGPYVRQYAVPVNPNTIAQVNARAAFGSSSANWHNLNSPQKAQWQAYAEGIFSPLNQANMGQFSGINAYTSLVNTVANANSKDLGGVSAGSFGSYTLLDSIGVPMDITDEANYGINLDPPSVFNTGTLETLGSVENVQLEVVGGSLDTDLNWSGTFKFIGVQQETPGPVPTSYNLGTTGLVNSVGTNVGIQCFMSETVAQEGDFVVNPYYINLGTTKPILATTLAIEGTQFGIDALLNGINRNNYQKLPNVGDKVRLTYVMIDTYGQRKVIGAKIVNTSFI